MFGLRNNLSQGKTLNLNASHYTSRHHKKNCVKIMHCAKGRQGKKKRPNADLGFSCFKMGKSRRWEIFAPKIRGWIWLLPCLRSFVLGLPSLSSFALHL